MDSLNINLSIFNMGTSTLKAFFFFLWKVFFFTLIIPFASTSDIGLSSYDFKKVHQECPWRIVCVNSHLQIFMIANMSSRQYKMNNLTWSSPKSSPSMASLRSHAISQPLITKPPLTWTKSFSCSSQTTSSQWRNICVG